MTAEIELSINAGAGLAEVGRATAAAADLCCRCGVPEVARLDLTLAIEEALSNILRHGRPSAVALAVRVRESEIEIDLEDDGPPFNPWTYPQPDTVPPVSGRPTGGVGIHMIRSLVELRRYERLENRNRVTFVKRLAKEG